MKLWCGMDDQNHLLFIDPVPMISLGVAIANISNSRIFGSDEPCGSNHFVAVNAARQIQIN